MFLSLLIKSSTIDETIKLLTMMRTLSLTPNNIYVHLPKLCKLCMTLKPMFSRGSVKLFEPVDLKNSSKLMLLYMVILTEINFVKSER